MASRAGSSSIVHGDGVEVRVHLLAAAVVEAPQIDSRLLTISMVTESLTVLIPSLTLNWIL